MKHNNLRLLNLFILFLVFTVKAKVENKIINNRIYGCDSTIIVLADSFISTCNKCKYDDSCINQTFENKYIKIEGSLFTIFVLYTLLFSIAFFFSPYFERP
jgi:hypothetical protein